MIAVTIGALFALPHGVRIAEVGYAAYSPFTAHSPSSMTYDETFLYGAEANYMLTRGAASYDDTWEHRAGVYPYSIVPTVLEAGLAAASGSLKLAHILASFVFPCVSALLLMALFRRAGADYALAGLLALAVLVLAFSPLTLTLDVRAALHHARGARVMDTLQAARDPNPSMTFPQFAGSLLLLVIAVERRGWRWAAAAGVLGGLLFFSYVYYAIAWTVLLCVLSVAALGWPQRVPRAVWIATLANAVFAASFLGWEHVSKVQGIYELRATRIGLYHSHALVGPNLSETAFWGAVTAVCAVVWLLLRRRNARAEAAMSVLLTAMVGGLAGMDMQVVTGFNLQQVQHYPHMVLQPVGFMMLGVLTALLWPKGPIGSAVAVAGFLVLLGLGVVAQAEAARDTAAMHDVPVAERALFAWLNANSPVGSVVATDDLALSVVLPVMTHNSVLMADGSRSSASDDELMERFLFASKLQGVGAAEVGRRLRGEVPVDNDTPEGSYPFYLFEFSDSYQPDRGVRRVSEARIPELLRVYGAMDAATELRRFRVDYLWRRTGDARAAGSTGLRCDLVFAGSGGTLCRLVRD